MPGHRNFFLHASATWPPKPHQELPPRLAESVIVVDTQEHLRLPEAVLLGGTSPLPPGGRLRVMGVKSRKERGLEATTHHVFSVVHKSKHSYKIQMSREVLQWVYKIYVAC